jgi:hypothetical protein
MEAVLNPLKHFGLASEDGYDIGICLLDHADGAGQQLGPASKAGAVVRSSKEGDAASASNNVLQVWLGPLFRLDQRLVHMSAHSKPHGGRRSSHIFAYEAAQTVADKYDRSFVLRQSARSTTQSL